MARATVLAALAVLGTLALGCTIAPADPASAEGPAVLATEPTDGAEGVSRRPQLRARFDRRLAPRSASRSTVHLESGRHGVDLSVWVDPVARELRASLQPGQALLPETVYRWTLDADLRDLEDRRLPEEIVVVFRTGSDVGADLPPAGVGWAQVEPLLRGRCGRAPCHAAPAPILGLDLSSAAGVRATALGRPARRALARSTGDEGGRGAGVLSGLALVDVVGGVGSPATSYLLYKVLGDPHAVGDAMPPPAGLSSLDAALLRDWIRAGAPTD